MMMMGRVMCVLAVVLCCACGYTMTAAADPAEKPPEKSGGYVSPDRGHAEWDDFPTRTKEVKWDSWYWNVPETTTGVRNQSTNQEEAHHSGGASGSGGHSGNGGVVVGSGEPQAAHVERASPGKGPSETAAIPEAKDGVTTTKNQSQGSSAASQDDQGASSSTDDNSTPVNSNLNQQPSATVDTTAVPDSPETNSTTPPSSENTTTAPPSTPSPLPNAEISSNTIASTVHKKANVDSSVSPVWMRTAAPLLIVAVFFSATVY
ncbi:uncharacterized protein TM35_000031640 [Trypanosoma theileri]|uniref:Mucin TcMUCII n=1 Tax=Trypanosoma theileri TaxID=67003 RepID=A0A1X0P6G3_9TRYP|nr:uncharacterized protein TM35_000031640 [Trypanosoma theileri]ORC92411.1 hypothetical protein TM35_000031640 [Trypanosoma theileri]